MNAIYTLWTAWLMGMGWYATPLEFGIVNDNKSVPLHSCKWSQRSFEYQTHERIEMQSTRIQIADSWFQENIAQQLNWFISSRKHSWTSVAFESTETVMYSFIIQSIQIRIKSTRACSLEPINQFQLLRSHSVDSFTPTNFTQELLE